MNKLELSDEQCEVLAQTLETDLSNLRYEIADTDSYDYREGLKHKKRVLEEILEQVKKGV